MSFFDSEIVDKEIKHIEFLRDLVLGLGETLEQLDNNEEIAIEYYHALYALVDKQHVLYTRLMFTDDPDAVILKKNLEDQARKFNTSTSPINMNHYYSMIKNDVKGFIQGITGEDLSNERLEIDIDILDGNP